MWSAKEVCDTKTDHTQRHLSALRETRSALALEHTILNMYIFIFGNIKFAVQFFHDSMQYCSLGAHTVMPAENEHNWRTYCSTSLLYEPQPAGALQWAERSHSLLEGLVVESRAHITCFVIVPKPPAWSSVVRSVEATAVAAAAEKKN